MHECHEHYQTYTDGSARCTVCGSRVSLLERERQSFRMDLLTVLGIADYMSEQLDHETGLEGEESTMCDTLHRIRERYFSNDTDQGHGGKDAMSPPVAQKTPAPLDATG